LGWIWINVHYIVYKVIIWKGDKQNISIIVNVFAKRKLEKRETNVNISNDSWWITTTSGFFLENIDQLEWLETPTSSSPSWLFELGIDRMYVQDGS